MKRLLLPLLLCCAQISFSQKGCPANACQDCLQQVQDVVKKTIKCNTCAQYDQETLLIYDAKTRKFYFSESQGKSKGIVQPLQRLNDLKLHFKKPFRLEIINLNRYLYNVNVGNSDVAFTSTEPLVMQQYLIAGSTNGQTQPANTYAAGGSGNYGDNIFNNLPTFKASIDKILGLVSGAASLNANSLSNLADKSKTVNDNSLSIKSSIDKIKELNNYSAQLDQKWSDMDYMKDITTNSDAKKNATEKDSFLYLEKVQDYSTLAGKIVHQIKNNTGNKVYKRISKDSNFIKFSSSVDSLNAALNQKSSQLIQDTTGRKINETAAILEKAFKGLEDYYNGYLDKKIQAYSVCTTDFFCCNFEDKEKDTLTYRYFDKLLTDIAIAYLKFKTACQTRPDPNQKKTDPAFITLNINAASLQIQDGKITGLKLSQVDSSKAKKTDTPDPTTAAITALDSLWFSFEKSISPDFIMRQILFVRNMTQENMQYISPPIYPYGERLGLLLQILASDSAKRNGVILDHLTTESLDFAVLGKPLFSFSGGSFVGIGNVLSSTYAYQQIPQPGSNTVQANSPYMLIKTGSGTTPIGIDGLANISVRIPGKNYWDFRIGLSAGVGTVITPSLQVAYLAGVNLSVGTYQQFHLTTGVLGMNINVLKDNLNPNSNILYTSVPNTDLYNQKIKQGWFLSLSYTLFTPKATGPTQIANAGTTTATGK